MYTVCVNSNKQFFQELLVYGILTLIAIACILCFFAHNDASMTPYARCLSVVLWSGLYFVPFFGVGILLISIAQLHQSIRLCVSVISFIVAIILVIWLHLSQAIFAFVMGILAALRIPDKH